MKECSEGLQTSKLVRVWTQTQAQFSFHFIQNEAKTWVSLNKIQGI